MARRGGTNVKTIGLIGGMSWESSAYYYRLLNEGVRDRLGGLHSARCVLYSVDFTQIEVLQREGRWAEAGEILADAARRVEGSGADFLVLCTNTMHRVAPAIEAAVSIPLLHIADPTAQRIQSRSIRTVGLLGTRFTMEEAFYKDRLVERHGLRVLVPPPAERERVHRIIYDELCLGDIRPASKAEYVRSMERMAGDGAEGIILGCTEIGLLVDGSDARVPLFDTTRIHAEAAVELALS
jgi:amino-acid racemase